MAKLYTWLLEVGLKTFGPSAIRGAILGISGWILVRNDLLEPFGILSDPQAHTTIIDWDKLNTGLIVLLPAVLAGLIKVANRGTKNILLPPSKSP